MLNLAEILTVIIGLLLALVFVDGIRRSIKNRKNKLKVDLVPCEKLEKEEFDELEDTSGQLVDENEFSSDVTESIEDIPILKGHNLIIFNLCSKDLETFSCTSLSKKPFFL